MLHVVLVEPEIHYNTGNVARTCAATGCVLHLIEPLGFSLEDRYLRRAGLDYWPLVVLRVHPSWSAFRAEHATGTFRFFATRGARRHTQASYGPDDYLVFGRESTGLPSELLERHRKETFRIPMGPGVRSLNLSNAVAVVVYEALRQRSFPGLA